MFCGKCGTKNADDAMFCAECGAKINEGQVSESNIAVVAAPNNKNRKVGMIAVAVIVAIVIVAGFAMFSGRSSKSLANTYMNARIDTNYNKIFSLYPKKLVEHAMEGWYIDDKDVFIEEFIKNDDFAEDVLYEADNKKSNISYEITEEDFSERSLSRLQSKWDDRGLNISAAKTITIRTNIKGSTKYFTTEIEAVKVGNSWYLWKNWLLENY